MANLVELFDNIVQMQNLNGVPLANGRMYVYALGRTRLMDTWSDVDGESLNSNPIILDAAGQCHCYVSDDFDYTLVVTDAYDNEIFSIDKYLYSQGSHSHADVAVAPSETIAVSSYHVGETTVYVPYLTGQLGKIYQGIDPIVVNNVEDKISAQHVPLGVQDPLYFVQDDEEGCIIGFSGQTIPEGVMTESALGFENDKITGYNGSAFSAGNEYEAGDNIDITNGVISGKDWSNEINDASAAATAWTDSQGYLTAVDIPESANWNSTYNTVHDNSASWTGGSGSGGPIYTPGANIDITNNVISGKDWTEEIRSATSGLQPSGDYATESWVTAQGYLTAETDWTDTITAASANAYNEATAAIPAPFDPTYLSGQIDTKLDSAIYVNDSATFLTALPQDLVYTADIADMATTGDLTGKQDITGMTAYATVESLTAKQDVGNYLSATDSANFLLTSDSGNFYPMTGNPSGFINELPEEEEVDFEEVDLAAYQPVSSMTAYANSANVTGTAQYGLTTAGWSEITAGGDVPEGVMVESGLEYNAVNEISGYNGSAIAQYGHEAQWLQHDDTIVHVSNSAQYALGVNLSAVAQLLGVDETVLWTNSNPSQVSAKVTLTGTLSESCSAFEKLRFICKGSYDTDETFRGAVQAQDFYTNESDIENRVGVFLANRHGQTIYRDTCQLSFKDTGFTANNGSRLQGLTTISENTTRGPYILQVIGIGRKQ